MDNLNTYPFMSRQVFLYIASQRSIQKGKTIKLKNHTITIILWSMEPSKGNLSWEFSNVLSNL